MTKICWNCNVENLDDARICGNCGQDLKGRGHHQWPTEPGGGKGGTKDDRLPPPPPPVPKGEKIGPWVIQREIGAGGMGVVYLGQDPSGRLGAVKLLSPRLSGDDRFRERFEREASTQKELRHERIAAVLDHGENDGLLYMVVEYLDGGSLAESIDKGGAATFQSLRWIRQALDGLEYAHQHNVIHRDIKPANVLLDSQRVAKVADFGIAISEGERRLTGTGETLGSPEYMSPEQIKARPVDRRSDIYSMGVVLYELLTGRPPFQGASRWEIQAGHVNHPPRPPHELNPAIPEELEQIVLKAMNKEPAGRYSTCAEFAKALEDFDNQQWPVVKVTRPQGNAAWVVGTSQKIEWTASPGFGHSLVSGEIHLVSGAPESRTTLFSFNVPGSSIKEMNWDWNIPSGLTGVRRIEVAVYDDEGNVGQGSSGGFSLAQKPVVTEISKPTQAGGSNWPAYVLFWLVWLSFGRMDLSDLVIAKPGWNSKSLSNGQLPVILNPQWNWRDAIHAELHWFGPKYKAASIPERSPEPVIPSLRDLSPFSIEEFGGEHEPGTPASSRMLHWRVGGIGIATSVRIVKIVPGDPPTEIEVYEGIGSGSVSTTIGPQWVTEFRLTAKSGLLTEQKKLNLFIDLLSKDPLRWKAPGNESR
jgi:serine/threonine protein kinase